MRKIITNMLILGAFYGSAAEVLAECKDHEGTKYKNRKECLEAQEKHYNEEKKEFFEEKQFNPSFGLNLIEEKLKRGEKACRENCHN